MNRQEDTQQAVDGIGVLAGADIDWGQINLPCAECGGMVDLSSVITVNIVEADGSKSTKEMTEANARALLFAVGILPPLVLCDQHDPGEITVAPW